LKDESTKIDKLNLELNKINASKIFNKEQLKIEKPN